MCLLFPIAQRELYKSVNPKGRSNQTINKKSQSKFSTNKWSMTCSKTSSNLMGSTRLCHQSWTNVASLQWESEIIQTEKREKEKRKKKEIEKLLYCFPHCEFYRTRSKDLFYWCCSVLESWLISKLFESIIPIVNWRITLKIYIYISQ